MLIGGDMPKVNYEVIRGNIKEAREELQKIEGQIAEPSNRSEVALQIGLEHAYHHLNFAWNARRATEKQYRTLSNENVNKWSKFPKDIHISRVPKAPA